MRDWFVVELGLYSGMRVFEMAKLRQQEIFIDMESLPFLTVTGKRKKTRTIYFSQALKMEYQEFLEWKRKKGEPDSYLFYNPHTKTHLTSRALQKSFKRSLQKAGLPLHFAIHSLRHTYALNLYIASGHNARLVQELLGHSDLKTTQAYISNLVALDYLKAVLERMYVSHPENKKNSPEVLDFYGRPHSFPH